MAKKQTDGKSEIEAMSSVFTALKDLEPVVQRRVLRHAAEMLGLPPDAVVPVSQMSAQTEENTGGASVTLPSTSTASDTQSFDDAEGINSVALKWMRRSGLTPANLQSFFSLGIDDIDLVAKSVPGANKKDRMRSVLPLKGIAAYLGTGAARVSYEQLKEACLHYDAYDGANFAAYLKSFAADVGGSKKQGFTLTPRGLTSATEVLKELLSSGKKQ